MHELFVTADGFPSFGMHHRHGNLLKIEGCCRRGSGVEFGGNVNVWRIGPDTFGEEIDCFLTYDISISEPPLNRNKPHLPKHPFGLYALQASECVVIVRPVVQRGWREGH